MFVLEPGRPAGLAAVPFSFAGLVREGRAPASEPDEVDACRYAIGLAELRYGAEARRFRKLHGLIDTFASTVAVVPFDADAATRFGGVVVALIRKGTPIGDYDGLIASHAMALDLTLVTNKTKHFSRVEGLRIDNWV